MKSPRRALGKTEQAQLARCSASGTRVIHQRNKDVEAENSHLTQLVDADFNLY